MGDEQQQQRNPHRFTEEIKRDAVNLGPQHRPADRGGRPGAGNLRLHAGQLGAPGRHRPWQERTRLRQLEAENARLRMERALLKRTVAFWVKEQSTP
jgi:transposase